MPSFVGSYLQTAAVIDGTVLEASYMLHEKRGQSDGIKSWCEEVTEALGATDGLVHVRRFMSTSMTKRVMESIVLEASLVNKNPFVYLTELKASAKLDSNASLKAFPGGLYKPLFESTSTKATTADKLAEQNLWGALHGVGVYNDSANAIAATGSGILNEVNGATDRFSAPIVNVNVLLTTTDQSKGNTRTIARIEDLNAYASDKDVNPLVAVGAVNLTTPAGMALAGSVGMKLPRDITTEGADAADLLDVLGNNLMIGTSITFMKANVTKSTKPFNNITMMQLDLNGDGNAVATAVAGGQAVTLVSNDKFIIGRGWIVVTNYTATASTSALSAVACASETYAAGGVAAESTTTQTDALKTLINNESKYVSVDSPSVMINFLEAKTPETSSGFTADDLVTLGYDLDDIQGANFDIDYKALAETRNVDQALSLMGYTYVNTSGVEHYTDSSNRVVPAFELFNMLFNKLGKSIDDVKDANSAGASNTYTALFASNSLAGDGIEAVISVLGSKVEPSDIVTKFGTAPTLAALSSANGHTDAAMQSNFNRLRVALLEYEARGQNRYEAVLSLLKDLTGVSGNDVSLPTVVAKPGLAQIDNLDTQIKLGLALGGETNTTLATTFAQSSVRDVYAYFWAYILHDEESRKEWFTDMGPSGSNVVGWVGPHQQGEYKSSSNPYWDIAIANSTNTFSAANGADSWLDSSTTYNPGMNFLAMFAMASSYGKVYAAGSSNGVAQFAGALNATNNYNKIRPSALYNEFLDAHKVDEALKSKLAIRSQIIAGAHTGTVQSYTAYASADCNTTHNDYRWLAATTASGAGDFDGFMNAATCTAPDSNGNMNILLKHYKISPSVLFAENAQATNSGFLRWSGTTKFGEMTNQYHWLAAYIPYLVSQIKDKYGYRDNLFSALDYFDKEMIKDAFGQTRTVHGLSSTSTQFTTDDLARAFNYAHSRSPNREAELMELYESVNQSSPQNKGNDAAADLFFAQLQVALGAAATGLEADHTIRVAADLAATALSDYQFLQIRVAIEKLAPFMKYANLGKLIAHVLSANAANDTDPTSLGSGIMAASSSAAESNLVGALTIVLRFLCEKGLITEIIENISNAGIDASVAGTQSNVHLLNFPYVVYGPDGISVPDSRQAYAGLPAPCKALFPLV